MSKKIGRSRTGYTHSFGAVEYSGTSRWAGGTRWALSQKGGGGREVEGMEREREITVILLLGIKALEIKIS